MGQDERNPYSVLPSCCKGQFVALSNALTPDAAAWLSVPRHDLLETHLVRSRPDVLALLMRSELAQGGIYHLSEDWLMDLTQISGVFSKGQSMI